MAPVGILWGASRQPQSKVICSVAALNDLELDFNSEWNYTEKPAGFVAKFTYGKIPAFEGSDGFRLIEGTAIARYLSGLGTKVKLLGSDAKEIALVDQWVHFAELEIGTAAYNAMGVIYGFSGPFNREALDKQLERLVRALTYVESHLAGRPSGYLVSDSLTLADIILAGAIYICSFGGVLGAAERAQYPNIYSHYDRATSDVKVKELWGREAFVEVAVREAKTWPST